ncbi:MAG: chromosome partitioning protein ParB [Eggerthella lenta]
MIAGHRRLEAYRRLAREDAAFRTIPVTLVDDLDDARARVLLNVTNLVTRRLSQEERGARYAAIGREVPALREADPSLKGVRTNDIIARIVTEETGQSVSPATVKRAIAAERRLRETREQAELLTGDLNENWQVEAQVGRRRSRCAPSRNSGKQLDLFAEYQRQEMTLGQLKAHLKASRPKTTADASRAVQAAIRSVEEARRMDREGVPLSQGLIRKLKSLVDQL